MNRSRSSNRLGLGSSLRRILGRRKSSPSRLAEVAGGAEQAFEPLENRQLLFTLTIGPGSNIDPITGIGTERAIFGYMLQPLIPTVAQQTTTVTPIDEDFNSDDPAAPVANIPTGFVFDQSNLRIDYTATSVRLVGAQTENQVQVVLQAGENLALGYVSGTGAQVNFRGSLSSIAMDILDGLNAADVTAEFLDADGVVIDSVTGAALDALGLPAAGNPRRYTFTTTANGGRFSQIRFVASPGAASDQFRIDNVTYVPATQAFANQLDTYKFGVTLAFSGPLGATIQVLDLYGQEMRQTIALGIPSGGTFPIVDPDGDGIPNYNNGIGKIIITGTNSNSALTMFGGTITAATTPPAGAEAYDGNFAYFLTDSILGLFDTFEQSGIGYQITLPQGGGQPTVTGLPPGPGSLMIGSPYVRPLNAYNPGGSAIQGLTVTGGFTRADQGIFVNGGASIGSVYIHGAVYGSSNYTGSVGRIVQGYSLGSISVAGDLGAFFNGSDAGMWCDDDGLPIRKTDAMLTVGRTLGQVAIAGRSLMNTNVIGDLTRPALNPPRDIFRYYELEYSTGLIAPATVEDTIKATIDANGLLGQSDIFGGLGLFFGRVNQSLVFGNGYSRNDTITAAEWIGSAATAVQINGELGQRDVVNTRQDPSDVYGFAVDGSQDINVQISGTRIASLIGAYMRLVDSDGRTVAAPQLSEQFQDVVTLRYRPNSPGVYYLVVQSSDDGAGNVSDVNYVLTVSGMAANTLGAYRTGSGFGNGRPGANLANTLTVLSGSMGSLRVGTAFVSGGGAEVDPAVIYNPEDGTGTDAAMSFRQSTTTIAGHLFNVTTGSDVENGQVVLSVGGNFGTFITGLSTVIGLGPNNGDFRTISMFVGGSIAMLDIRGGLGVDQDPTVTPKPVDAPNSIVIRTGTNPQLKGDLGMFRVGWHAGADTLNLRTSDNSVIGGFMVSQDVPGDAGPDVGIYTPGGTGNGETIVTGFNSDLRFFDTPQIDLQNLQNQFIPLVPNTPVVLTDDGGGQVSIRIISSNAGVGTGLIRVIPISGSQGVAIGRIEADLTGGARLQITSQGAIGNSNVISIGHIIITAADNNASIGIDGNTQVDVWSIQGADLAEVVNITPNGDIVAIDTNSIPSVQIRTGNLGRTQVPKWGPQLIGPFIGIGGQGGGGSGGPIQVPANAMTAFWNGNTYRPVNYSVNTVGNSFLDDVGSPVDPFLNGVVSRTGDIVNIQVGGAVGDVMAATGNIISVTANFDRVPNLPGQFEGIVGNIYGNRISLVDVGDGLAQRDPSPISTTGIFANDDIFNIVGNRIANANISSTIMAGNNVVGNNTPNNFPVDGISSIDLRLGGSYIDAYIGSENIDGFWVSFFAPDSNVFAGDMGTISGTGANFLRSTMAARTLNLARFTGGYYDASTTRIGTNLTRMEAVGYRNSTINGGELEFRINQVSVGGDLGLLTTFNRAGNIDDLTVDVLGTIGEMSGNNISRSKIDADVTITLLQTLGSIRGSSVTTGQLTKGDFKKDVAASEFNIAGPLVLLTAGDSILNSSFNVSGPDGSIDKITSRLVLTGSITSAGPINTIEVTEGDMIASISTVTNIRGFAGDITLLKAARDLDIRTDIGGNVGQLVAGRHIGNINSPGVILIRGSATTVDAAHGQIYSDLRVAKTLDTVLIGRVAHLPGQSLLGAGSIIAFGRIGSVAIEGDFAGAISSASGGIGAVTILNGSLLPTASITALDGDIGGVTITAGNLYGSIHADYILYSVRVVASADGVFGDIGVTSDPNLTAGTPYDQYRNQLPPDLIANANVQGPRITAGKNLGRITTTDGSMYETFVYAKRAIGTLDINGSITKDALTTGQASVIAAGSSIFAVLATGSINATDILVGIRSFGQDNRPGGFGLDTDIVQSGRITTIHGNGSGTDVIVSAGLTAGADGQYNTFDEKVVLGISYVREVTFGGPVSNVSVFADSPTLTTSVGVVTAGTTFPNLDPDLSTGAAVGTQLVADSALAFTWGGVSGTITYSGPGKVYWDAANGTLNLVNTKLSTTLNVTAGGTLTNFNIVTNDDASMGAIVVGAALAGDSHILIDAYSLGVTVGDFSGTGSIAVGMNVRGITTGNFTSGFIRAAFWAKDIIINGAYGTPGTIDEARMDVLAGSTITITGEDGGLVNIDRDLTTFTVGGAMNEAQVRAGNTIGAVSAASMYRTRVSAGDALGPVAITGNADETIIMAGGDLGADVLSGGIGEYTDQATTGTITSLTVGGNFRSSSAVAGFLRGPDGFFGTPDDIAGPGLSTLGPVTITGLLVGSNTFTEQYRVMSTGTLGTVLVGGQPVTNQLGNFRALSVASEPTPIRVVDLQIGSESNTWTATFFFNQAMNAATFGPALTISEVRNSGGTLVPLVAGTDYTVGPYNANNNSIVVIFSRAVTDRNLVPQGGIPAPGSSTPGTPDPFLPGPGVFRFELDSSILRARITTARLDGDANGFASANENYTQDGAVGDAGDKFAPEVTNVATGTNPDELIDLYGPVDLDLVLDSNLTPDGLPEINTSYTLRGTIGDNPDNNVTSFRTGGDVDIYRITLLAGQILRLGAMNGPANFAGRGLYNAAGELQGGTTADSVQLPTTASTDINETSGDDYLIKTSGTYYIVVGNTDAFLVPGLVPNVNPGAGDTGKYDFSITVFDDENSGFGAQTAAGNGTRVPDAPAPIVFAGPNGVFQNPGDPTYDDLSIVTIGDFRFLLDAGADGVRGTADDVVSGSNGKGITSTRSGNELSTTINSAIGPNGHSGVPGAVASDVDIYNLNNGQTIAPGRVITATVKLAQLGADLGGFSPTSFQDFRGSVQFGLFDTTSSVAVDDGLMVFSPTDFLPRAGTPGEIARQGASSYGYDAEGNFYISFVVPDRVGGQPGEAGTFALYLQGVFNTDYTIDIRQNDGAQPVPLPVASQNLFLEMGGGVIDWLQAGGIETQLASFATSVLGFTGTIAGQSIDQYVINNLVTRVQSIFNAAGVNVVVSDNPSTFELQPYSTVFVTGSTDPTTIFNTNNFGYSEHSDPYNLDRNDEGVVFLPSFATLGYTPTQADIDNLVLSLASAVTRRAGELMGLRISESSSPFDAPIDVMSANSPQNVPGFGNAYAFTNTDRALSGQFDGQVNTDFFIGRQNAFALLDKFLLP